ncbi:MAG: Gfo/Idh/MocA family oxidoreductase [Clostridia bacterium]|nr:Gfo/Idh/MocA family oxidoreductase [Clostridia bacterium]
MLKVGLIGCGFMGGMHSACYKAIDGVEVVAVADVRLEKAQEIARVHNAEIYATGMELIENANVDIIDICLPTYLHTEHAVAAMKKVKNVFIEKPVCLNEAEGELLLKTQKETGANVQIGQVIRFWDEYVWLKEVFDKKEYGEVLSAAFCRLSSRPTWAWDNWLHTADKSGSMALDLHVHDVDFMRYMLGEPDGLTSTAVRNADGVIEQIFTTYTYGGKAVSVEGCWDYPADFPFTAGFRVKFEKATVVLDAGGLAVYFVDGGSFKPEIKPAFEADNDIGGNLSSLGGYYNELKYFVDNIAEGKALEVAPLCEGVKSVNLILKEIAFVGGAQKK